MFKSKLKKILLTISAIAISLLPISNILASDTLYENYTDYNTFQWCWDSGDNEFIFGQTFTPQTSHNFTSAKLKLYKVGNPGDVKLYLWATSGGLPTGAYLDIKTINGNTITTDTDGELVEFTFTSSTLLTAGNKYALILRTPDGSWANNIWAATDNTSPTYSRGNIVYTYNEGVTWDSSTLADLVFYEYGLSLTSKPTLTTEAVSAVGSVTATGNGTITATGGENATKRGVVYDTTSYGNPSNVSPLTSNYDFWEEESGDFGVGAFTASLTGLNIGETYYVRAYAYNSKGYSYGDEVNFTTALTTPTITINAASNVAKTSARLNSLLDDAGGEDCDIRFGYGTVSEAAIDFLDYEIVTDWVNTYSTGSHPYFDATSLVADTEYFFRVQAKNSEGTVTSTDEESFTTEAAIAACTNFKALPQATSISLSWIKGTGASQTLIRYSFDAYPAGIGDGIQLYLSTGSSATHTDLVPGTTIYYTAWGESDGGYSSSVNLLALTSAGTATGVDVDSPIMPTNWFLDTDYTTMSNFEPLFTTINDGADALNMPRSTAWYLAAIIFSVLASYATYQIGHQQLVPAAVVMVICIGLMSTVQLIPMYMLFLIIIVIIGVGVARRSM